VARVRISSPISCPSHSCPSSEHISISIDPFTGRNPSYAFVDLTTPADAQRAIAELDEKEMLGRPIRIKPGVAPRQPLSGPSPVKYLPYVPPCPTFYFCNNSTSGRGRIWDRWKKREDEATAHFDYANTGRRVYVGNLPSFDMKPARVDAEIKHFFNGLQMYVHIFHPIVSEKKNHFPVKPFPKSYPLIHPISQTVITSSSTFPPPTKLLVPFASSMAQHVGTEPSRSIIPKAAILGRSRKGIGICKIVAETKADSVLHP
jgi:hypothetical protein